MHEPPAIDLAEPDELPLFGRERFCVNTHRSRKAHIWIGLFLIMSWGMLMMKGSQPLWGYVLFLGMAGVASAFVELMLYLSKDSAVVLDYERKVVVLEHYVYPLGFWDFRSKPEVVIPFSEIQHVSRFEGKGGRTYYVFTKQSRFNLGRTIDRIDELALSLESIASGSIPLHPLRNPWILGIFASLIGGGLVLLLAWLLGWI